MYKIFLVKENSEIELEINKLLKFGTGYIPTFERNLGVIDFCLDLEVITKESAGGSYFLVISGNPKITNYHNESLKEITDEQLKSSYSVGYSVVGTGTNQLLALMGYKLTPFNECLNRIELIS